MSLRSNYRNFEKNVTTSEVLKHKTHANASTFYLGIIPMRSLNKIPFE